MTRIARDIAWAIACPFVIIACLILAFVEGYDGDERGDS